MTLPLFFDTRAHLLVCTSGRCVHRGARAVFDAAWEHSERAGIAYHKTGGSVRVTEAGCLGACEHGPNAVAYFGSGVGQLSQAWYCRLDEDRARDLLDALHEGQALPSTGRFDR